MATQATVVRCNQCNKAFEGATEEAAVRSFKGHATRMKHVEMFTVEDTNVVDAATTEPTNIDAKRAEKEAAKEAAAAGVAARKAEREAKAAAKAEAKAKAAADRAAAAEARKAPRTEPCECGCGGIPAGRKSRFLPGHDAKKASAEKADKAPTKATAKPKAK